MMGTLSAYFHLVFNVDLLLRVIARNANDRVQIRIRHVTFPCCVHKFVSSFLCFLFLEHILSNLEREVFKKVTSYVHENFFILHSSCSDFSFSLPPVITLVVGILLFFHSFFKCFKRRCKNNVMKHNFSNKDC